MLKVENLKNSTKEYLAEHEEQLEKMQSLELQARALDRKQYKEFCKEHGIDPKKNKNSFEAYLNNGQSHNKARVSESVKQVFGVDGYSRKTFEKLLNGESPVDAKKLKPEIAQALRNDNGDLIRKDKNQKSGFGMVGSCPKGVSVLYTIADDMTRNNITEAMFSTSEAMVNDIAKSIKPSTGRQEYLDFDPSQTKLFATYHDHIDARPDEKNKAKLSKEEIAKSIDTHKHTHITVSNVALFAFYKRDDKGEIIRNADGKPDYEYRFLAVDGKSIFQAQLENSAKFDAVLNSELQKRGIKTEAIELDNGEGKLHDTFTVKGISREDELKCSRRSETIFKEAKKQNKNKADTEYLKKVSDNTKATKIEFSADELNKCIKENTLEAVGKNKFSEVIEAQAKAKQQHEIANFNELLQKNASFNNEGYITPTKLRQMILRKVQYEKTFDSIDELNKTVEDRIAQFQNNKEFGVNSLIPVYDKHNEIKGYTRLSNAIHERSFVHNLDKLVKNVKTRTAEERLNDNKFLEKFIEEAKQKGFEFNEGQKKGMKESLKLGYEGSKVMLTLGQPGTGKTVSLCKFQNELWTNRYGANKVYGISVANVATKALVDAGIDERHLLNSTSFVKKAFKVNEKTGEYELNPKFINDKKNHNNLYIFDEFGLEGSKLADLVQKAAIATNSSISYVGDPAQLASVSYGSPIKYTQQFLEENAKDRVVVLDEILRQKNDRGLEIVRCYQESRVEDLFKNLEKENALTVAKNQPSLLKEVANDYLTNKAPTANKLIIAQKNSTLDELNKTIRDKVKKENLDPSIDFSKEVKLKVARNGTEADIQREASFAPGERIVFLKGIKEIDPNTGFSKKDGWSIDNSELAIIKEIKRGQSGSYNITVSLNDGKEAKFNTADFNYFSNSYAVSCHKSQGMSKLEVFHIGESDSKNNAIVAGSRHTGTKDTIDEYGNTVKGELGYHLYLTEKNVEKFKVSITKEQQKFTTLDNQECDKAVQNYCDKEVKREIAKPLEMPYELQKQLTNENELLDLAKIQSKQIEEKLELEAKQKLENSKVDELTNNLSNSQIAEAISIKETVEYTKPSMNSNEFRNPATNKDRVEEVEVSNNNRPTMTLKEGAEWKAPTMTENIQKAIQKAKDSRELAQEKIKEVVEEYRQPQAIEEPKPTTGFNKYVPKVNLSRQSDFQIAVMIKENPSVFEENTAFISTHSQREFFTNNYLEACNDKYHKPEDVEKSIGFVKEVGLLTPELIKTQIMDGYLSTEDKFLEKFIDRNTINKIENEITNERIADTYSIANEVVSDMERYRELGSQIYSASQNHRHNEIAGLSKEKQELFIDIVESGKLENVEYVKNMPKDIFNLGSFQKEFQEAIKDRAIPYDSELSKVLVDMTTKENLEVLKEVYKQAEPQNTARIESEMNEMYKRKYKQEFTNSHTQTRSLSM